MTVAVPLPLPPAAAAAAAATGRTVLPVLAAAAVGAVALLCCSLHTRHCGWLPTIALHRLS
jgi:hypothetical protein